MTDADALLAAILAAPADDAPRLVYADWLDEHGQAERAAFIRVQCELARLRPPPVVVTERCVLTRRYGPGYYTLSGGEGTAGGGVLVNEIKVGSRVDVLRPRGRKPMHGLRVHRIGSFERPDSDSEIVVVEDAESKPWAGDALRRRERELLATNRRAWLADLPPGWVEWGTGGAGSERSDVRYEFRRGFVDEVRLPLDAFLEHAAALFAAHPVTAVRLVDREPASVWYPAQGALTWTRGGRSPSDLPVQLWLPGCGGGGPFPTRDAALAALSAAAVRFGRVAAGLERINNGLYVPAGG